MFRLTREVRFAVNRRPDNQLSNPASNSFAGYPSLTGFGQYFALQVTLEGPLQSKSGYLRNIKEIDSAVRQRAIPLFESHVHSDSGDAAGTLLGDVFTMLSHEWPGSALVSLRLALSPFLSMDIIGREFPMIRLNQKFEFSATHRLHNPAISPEENARLFGKCNNPHGHGHNYELQVTLSGQPNAHGELMEIPTLERLVQSTVIDRFDHRNLNVELPEFKELNPTVENIARVIYRLLVNPISDAGATLASVTLWETPKTFCEYTEREAISQPV